MKIMHVTTHLEFGGISSYILGLSAGLKKLGHDCIIVSSGGVLEDRAKAEGISHYRLDLRTKSEVSPKLWINLAKIMRIIQDEKVQVLHAHTRVTQVLSHAIWKFKKVPYITTCHGFFKAHFTRLVFPCWGIRTIAISEAVRQHLIRDFRLCAENISLIYTGIDGSKFTLRYDEKELASIRKEFKIEKPKLVGSIGRVSPVKGFDLLISAAAEILKIRKDIDFLIIGEGKIRPQLESMARSLSISEHVKFVNNVSDTARAMAIMDVFVMPSIQEGLGLSIMEALAAGKAVVASDVGGISNIIRDQETGLLFSPGDFNSLAQKLIQLLDDKALGVRLGGNGRRLIGENFSIEKMAKSVEELYLEVIG